MTIAEFRKNIKQELETGNKKVALIYRTDSKFYGNMFHTKKEALDECKRICSCDDFSKDNQLNIAVYKDNNIEVLGTNEILLNLNVISEFEYYVSTNNFC